MSSGNHIRSRRRSRGSRSRRLDSRRDGSHSGSGVRRSSGSRSRSGGGSCTHSRSSSSRRMSSSGRD